MKINFLPVSLALSVLFSFSVKAQSPDSKRLLLNYEFNQNAENDLIIDSSQSKNHAKIKGDGVTVTDGMLILPGGDQNTNGGYVEIPADVFKGKDTLTISLWLKNETGAGNYAAAYLGSAGTPPSKYWILNPKNADGRFKSVLSNAPQISSPWLEEKGFSATVAANGVIGPVTGDDWGLYTTVIMPEKIISYYNNEKLGEVAVTGKVSDMGSDLKAYIGRSSYADKYFKGAVKSFKVYDTAISEKNIIDSYFAGADKSVVMNALKEDAAAMAFTEQVIVDNLDLPQRGLNGSTIVWKTSDKGVINNKGAVKRDKKKEKKAVMTAVFTLGSESVSKDYEFTVLANNPENDITYYSIKLDPAITYVTEDISLPAMIGNGCNVSWRSSEPAVIDANGKVNRPTVNSGDQEVTLTATISKGGVSIDKTFKVTVAEADFAPILSYNIAGGKGENQQQRNASFYLAKKCTGDVYEEMNNGKAVVYPLAGSKKLSHPQIFRKPDGTFGMIAADNNNQGFIVYDSPDLIEYLDETFIPAQFGGSTVENLTCKYDNALKGFVISWATTDGKNYTAVTSDLKNLNEVKEVSGNTFEVVTATIPEGAKDVSEIYLTKKEYERVVRKFQKLQNTGIAEIPAVRVKKGDTPVLPETVSALYNDGTQKNMGVVWDNESLAKIKNVPGTYNIEGEIVQPIYRAPFIAGRADPWVFLGDDGYYYFTASYPMFHKNDPQGYDRIILRRSKTVEGLADAEEIVIWDEENTDNSHRWIWAPEIHQINGTWYVFFTASVDKKSVWGIRPKVIVCNKGDKDPFKSENWETEAHPCEPHENDKTAYTVFSLDMTHFENKGTHYVAWAQIVGSSSVLLASVDENEPWKATSEHMILTMPEFAWEWQNDRVNEGPAVIKNNGKIYIAYSASSVNETYCVGLMYADEDSDLLDPASWTKLRYPILSTEDLPGSLSGPGHNSFTVDEYGNPIIVYHVRDFDEPWPRDLYDAGRHAMVKRVNFAYDGTPVLNMTAEQELDPVNKKVTIEVIVE